MTNASLKSICKCGISRGRCLYFQLRTITISPHDGGKASITLETPLLGCSQMQEVYAYAWSILIASMQHRLAAVNN